MRTLLTTLLIILAGLCIGSLLKGDEAPPTVPEPPRYDNIQSDDGKILAVIDTKLKKTEYKTDPKVVVDLLVGRFRELRQNCQSAINQTNKDCAAKIKPWWKVW